VQVEAIDHWRDDRFTIQVNPTGIGKSLIYMAAALLRCDKTTILTSTKGLQDQLVKDFSDIGLVEVKGRSNYPCIRGDGPTADDGWCHLGMDCSFKYSGCPYYDAVRKAAQARYVVTNYALWLYAPEIRNSPILIMDEAHSAANHLDSFLSVEVDLANMSDALEKELLPPNDWAEFVWLLKPEVDAMVELGLRTIGVSIKILKRLIRVKRVLDALARLGGSRIVAEKIGDRTYQISPVHLHDFAESYLFRGTDSVLLTSATVTEYDAKRLGIGKYAYREFPSIFPIENRPVTFLPTVKVDRGISKMDESLWFSRIEAILRTRKDRSGIIHAVSYDRARRIAAFLKNKARVIFHNPKETLLAVRKFKNSTMPVVLVSPAMTTGWDFPYDECEFQIIAKVPFPDSTSLIQQERSRIDPDLPRYQAWQSIVQASGRGVRAVDDRCETLIIDDHFKWLNGRYWKLAPKWFREAINTVKVLPAPPEKLDGRRRQER
jgi:Rad3-related DNA helicase